MPTVSFITFCHPPHLERLHKKGVLWNILAGHRHKFDEVLLVHQRCRGLEYRPIAELPEVRILESEDYYPQIFGEFGIQWPDPVLDELTHGPEASHFWAWHSLNHLIGLKEAKSEYIVFADCDTEIIKSGIKTWVQVGIEILENRRDVFCVSPSDGGDERMTQNMSQQLFLVEAARMRSANLGLPWNGKFDAPGGPMQEYYGMMEGRIGRLLTTYQMWRYVLPPRWRYWHYGDWQPKGWDE